jgi:hypothetical protein
MDTVAMGEVVERELDTFISRRAEKNGAATAEEMVWKSSVRHYNAARSKEIGAQWYAYHADQAERLRRTMEPLIAHHEARARKLLEES